MHAHGLREGSVAATTALMPDSLETPRARAVVPKHAASLLVLRAAPDGLAVLMGLRGARHRFMPNRLVFPGGRVDRGDYRAKFATPPPPETLRLLEKAARPALAHALAAAAARELEEETGLSLGTPPALGGLAYLCRAVTPPGQPIRFNARFLVVEEAAVSGTLAGSGELEDLRYLTVEAALALDLALVTRRVLEQLKLLLAIPEPARRARTETAVVRNRHLELE